MLKAVLTMQTTIAHGMLMHHHLQQNELINFAKMPQLSNKLLPDMYNRYALHRHTRGCRVRCCSWRSDG